MASKNPKVDSEKLLITGITGYIGFKTLIIALERGYHVRGIVRKERNIAELKGKSSLIAESHEQGRLEFAIVTDFLEEGAVGKVLDGITVIIHLASPLAVESDDYEGTIIGPAISMVTTVLEAAVKVPTIRRVVLTSSCVTLIPFEWNMNPDNETLYTEDHINDNPTGPFSNAMEAYWASKARARIATRDFIAQKKPQFDFVNLLPSVVIGPDERISTGEGKIEDLLQGTRTSVLAPALSGSLNSPFPYVAVPVHVADVARAHVDAVDGSLIPGNSEYILCSDTPEGVVWDRDITDIARRYFPKEVESKILPLEGSLATIKWRLDGMRTEETFGWKFISFEETMRQLIAQYVELQGK